MSIDVTRNIQQAQTASEMAPKIHADNSWIPNLLNDSAKTGVAIVSAMKKKDEANESSQSLKNEGAYTNEITRINDMRANNQITDEQVRIAVTDIDRAYSSSTKATTRNSIKSQYGFVSYGTSFEKTQLEKRQETLINEEADKDKEALKYATMAGLGSEVIGSVNALNYGRQMVNSANDFVQTMNVAFNSNEGSKEFYKRAGIDIASSGLAVEILGKFHQNGGQLTQEDRVYFRQNVAKLVDATQASIGSNFRSVAEKEAYVDTIVNKAFGNGNFKWSADTGENLKEHSQTQLNQISSRINQEYQNLIDDPEIGPLLTRMAVLDNKLPVLATSFLTDVKGNEAVLDASRKIIGGVASNGVKGIQYPSPRSLNWTQSQKDYTNYLLTNPSTTDKQKVDTLKTAKSDKNSYLGGTVEEVSNTINNASPNNKEALRINNADLISKAVESYNTLTDPQRRREMSKDIANILIGQAAVDATALKDLQYGNTFVEVQDDGSYNLVRPNEKGVISNALNIAAAIPGQLGSALVNRGLGGEINRATRAVAEGIVNTPSMLRRLMGEVPTEDLVPAYQNTEDYIRGSTAEKELAGLNGRLKSTLSTVSSVSEINPQDVKTVFLDNLIASGVVVKNKAGEVMSQSLASQPTETIEDKRLQDYKDTLKFFESSNDPVGFVSPRQAKGGYYLGHGSQIKSADDFARKLSPVTGQDEEALKEIWKNKSQRDLFTITAEQSDKLLTNDLNESRTTARKFVGNNWDKLPESLKYAITDTAYEAGLGGFNKLKEFVTSSKPSYHKILKESIVREGTNKTRQSLKVQMALDEGWLVRDTEEFDDILKIIETI